MKKFTKYGWWVLIMAPFVFAFVVFVNNGYKFDNKYSLVKAPLTVPLFDDNNLVEGETIFYQNQDGNCFTLKEIPKDNEYISYRYDRKCYMKSLYSSKALAIEKLLDESYDSLYNSRELFDTEIKKLNSVSKDMNFLWHPDYEKNQYRSGVKVGTEEKSIIDIGKYKLTVTSPWVREIDYNDYYTHIVITKDGKSMDVKDYKKVNFSNVYKIQVGEVSYYLLGLCGGGARCYGTLIPIVYANNELRVGKIIEDVDFSENLRTDNFFTKNSELYLVLDDIRYFFSYSGSNNASYNSAVPRIFKFDKKTADLVLSVNNFIDLYKKATEKIEKDLYSLRASIPNEIPSLIMNGLTGVSLIPYFDYYLGMAIIADSINSSETRKKVEKLYLDFYGENSPEVHFDGYKDFER